MKVLVTGGAGFIGTNLIKSLLKKGHEVISIDNYNTGLKVNHQQGCKYINNDIRDFSTYQSHNSYHLHNVDVVFHMAAIARIQPSFDNPQDYFTTNANGTLNLVDWCAKNKIPFIYAGSSSKHNGKFKNPYTFSKDIGEEIIELYQEHFSLKSSITRFYNVYGQYQLLSGGYTTLIGRWINDINEGLRSVIYGDGEKRRDFTHVDDIVNALILIMEKEAYGYEFELGRGKNYSINEVAEMFGITPEYEANKKGEAQNTLNKDTMANEILGWNPQRELLNYIKTQIKTQI